MYQSISSIKHLFFSFSSDFFLYQLDFCLLIYSSLELSVAFHLASEFLFFVLFQMLWMLVTVNKAKFLLRKILLTFSKIYALEWILVTVYKNEFTSWKTLITFKCSPIWPFTFAIIFFSEESSIVIKETRTKISYFLCVY